LIEVVPSKADGRAKLLSVSAKGNQHLKARSALLKLSLEG
jgi:DNA-binding MarR family transcriptional regulator